VTTDASGRAIALGIFATGRGRGDRRIIGMIPADGRDSKCEKIECFVADDHIISILLFCYAQLLKELVQ
jgi:hypothetical protein